MRHLTVATSGGSAVLVFAIAATLIRPADGGQNAAGAPSQAVPGPLDGFVQIPAGQFARGDHHGFADPKHGSDEVPVRTIRVDSFAIGVHDVTTRQYAVFLNAALAQGSVEVRNGGVYLSGGGELLCETRDMSKHSRIGWDGRSFTVLDKKESHPVVCVRWEGAAAYCNWLSVQNHRPPVYNTTTWRCDFNKSGFRLPTEAEWEYAARGGQQEPYWNFPWANEPDPNKANWPESRNPYRAGPLPWTTPVGFFNGKLQRKSDLDWPAADETFQAADGVNGYGLYDMAGNVWQWCTEWYERNYYAYCPDANPPGPAEGSPMPDGKPYRCLRGGNWFNGQWGHSRVSNRDPAYFRGPQDPNHPFYHIGFRVVLPIDAESRPVIEPTPVQRGARSDARAGERPPRAPDRPGGRRPPRRDDRRGSDQGPDADRNRGGGSQPLREAERRRDARDESGENKASASQRRSSSAFVLRSPDVEEGGNLPKDYTGDGSSATLPLQWSGAPEDTRSFALVMHHVAPDAIKWYWVLYNIPPDVTSLPRNVHDIGTLGNNSINDRVGYAPPHSKGPGPKKYTYTVYALSAPPQIREAPAEMSREKLLSRIEGAILARAELNVIYTREPERNRRGPDGRAAEGEPPPRPRK